MKTTCDKRIYFIKQTRALGSFVYYSVQVTFHVEEEATSDRIMQKPQTPNTKNGCLCCPKTGAIDVGVLSNTTFIIRAILTRFPHLRLYVLPPPVLLLG
jgi:hypothetical protein